MKGQNPRNIILLGRSGSGKDTQAKLLAQNLKYHVFTTGDVLRAAAKEETPLGKRLHAELEKGNLAPTWLVCFFWERMLTELKPDKGIIFNGSPRRLPEAKLLDEVLAWLGREEPRVILVDVGAKEALDRLTKRRICTSCGAIIPYVGEFKFLEKCHMCDGALKTRSDDKPAVIKTRFSWFTREVGPVIRYYERRGVLTRVNGEQSIEGVFKDILKALS